MITIQSQVVHGKVGNSVAVPALQAHGVTVAAVPTCILSNHPHYPTVRGRMLPADLVAALLTGIEERGLVGCAAVLITGFLGTAEVGHAVARFVERSRRINPELLYICDPVCGDEDLGALVDPKVSALFAEQLLPLAHVATPNAWEARVLTGCDKLGDAARALQLRGTGAVCVTGGSSEGDAVTHVFDRQHRWAIRTPRLQARPAGSGDLFTACLAANLALGRNLTTASEKAVASVFAVLEATPLEPWSEMPIETHLGTIVDPRKRFRRIALHTEKRR